MRMPASPEVARRRHLRTRSAPMRRAGRSGRCEPGSAPTTWRANSLYLIVSSGLQAPLGFAFWIVAARLFSGADVGRTSSLISARVMIAYLALLGLNSTLVRYLPTAPNKEALICAGLLVVAVCGSVIGLLYVLATPVIAPRLDFIEHRALLTVGFVMLTAAASVNLLTDSVFIASR